MKKFTTRFILTRGLLTFLSLFLWCNSQAQIVLVPFTGSTSVPCGSNVTLQDHAGTSSYANNADGFVVLNAGFQAVISIAGSYDTEPGFDYIRIYSGVGTGGPLLATYNALNSLMTFVGAPGQTLTVRFQTDGSVVYTGFNLNVTYSGPCFAAPCAGANLSNTVLANPLTVCPGTNATLALAYQYSLSGLSYQWMSSGISAVGPFTAIPNATMSTLSTPTIGANIYFQAVVTCSTGPVSYSTAGQQILVQGTTTNSVPYFENFEGITVENKLPNCSWAASNIPSSTLTYTSSGSNNRVPKSGNNFASFFNSPAGVKYFYTNGIQMEPGITYSANIWYATEYFGYNNWTNLAVLVGNSQTPTGLVQVASVAPAISGPYKALGGTFTVSASGLYYVAVRATGAAGNAPYLSWDDISVTIPCTPSSGNSPTISVSANPTTICSGDQVSLVANGANSYSWSEGSTTSNIVVSPVVTTTYIVVGTNTLTGCPVPVSQVITVNPSPTVFIVGSSASVCPGQSAFLTAYGANAFSWSNNTNGQVITVTPANSAVYTAQGTNQLGCSGSATFAVAVLPKPSISATGVDPNEICPGTPVTITALGGVSYLWYSNTSSMLLQGNPVTVYPSTTTSYTVEGIGTNGCSNRYTLTQNVGICTGLENFQIGADGAKIYPNPSSGMLTVERESGLINSITIVDISGRLLFSAQGHDSKMQIDISELSNGVYYLTIGSDTSNQVLRVIKN